MTSNMDFNRMAQRVQKLFWDPPPKNDDPVGAPIWCLGKKYDSRTHKNTRQSSPSFPQDSPPALSAVSASQASEASSADAKTESSVEQEYSAARQTRQETTDKDGIGKDGERRESDADGGWPSDFLDDFESRIWMTYRSNFTPIPKSSDPKAASSMSFSVRLKQLGNQTGFTTDSGWGCMIRSGQCLLANALLQLELGRDWRRGVKGEEEKRLLALFADDPKAPFSIHKFVEHGASACGKHPGEWFGPSATAQCIQALSHGYEKTGLRVCVTGDGADVYENEFFKVAKSNGTFQPTLLLVGTRLGIDRVTPVYWEALKATLQMPQSVGIAGGRPDSSHYFIGTQGQYFFYLDPHTTRPLLPLHSNPEEYSPEEVESCHTRRLRRIRIDEMDPSMLIAFLIRDEDDWKAWRKGVTEVHGKAIIHVADKEPALHGHGVERESAIDEVETFDDDDDEDEGVMV